MEKTSEEKWELLIGLGRHGANIEALDKVCPRWTKAELDMIIKRYKLRAQKEKEKEAYSDSHIKKWYDFLSDLHQVQGTVNQRGNKSARHEPSDHAPVLSKLMMYAAFFEEHWEGSNQNDPNYSEIYRYLSQLLSGSEPTHLSPGSAAKILEMFNKIKEISDGASALPHVEYLQALPHCFSTTIENEDQNGESSGQENEDRFTSKCPLFEEEDENLTSAKLEPKDPYYEVKKEKVNKKLENLQQETATGLEEIPGLNPLAIPAKYMVDPSLNVTTRNKI